MYRHSKARRDMADFQRSVPARLRNAPFRLRALTELSPGRICSVVSPMLISPASVLPAGEEWAFEVKWDGMRALVSVGPAVRVHSRHAYDHTAAFPELVALGSLAGGSKAVLDGELVCLEAATGRPSFERLMARTQARLPTLSARRDPATFVAFDVLAVDGVDVCARPWGERRNVLQKLARAHPRRTGLAGQHRLCRRAWAARCYSRHGPVGVVAKRVNRATPLPCRAITVTPEG